MKLKKSQRVLAGIVLVGFLLLIFYVCYVYKSPDEPYIKFTSRPTPTIPVISYTTKGQGGDTCFVDEQCASGRCDRKKFQCEKLEDKVCACDESGYVCAYETAADNAKLKCCPYDKLKTWMSYVNTIYCGDMKDGSKCWSDAMCESGYCKGNWGGVNPEGGTCTRKKKNGEDCDSNADCESTDCGRGSAADNAQKVCCANGYTTYGGFDYCKSMPHGSTCWSDAMCADGRCGGGAGVLGVNVSKGTCMTEQEYRALPPPEANLGKTIAEGATNIGNQIYDNALQPAGEWLSGAGDTIAGWFR